MHIGKGEGFIGREMRFLETYDIMRFGEVSKSARDRETAREGVRVSGVVGETMNVIRENAGDREKGGGERERGGRGDRRLRHVWGRGAQW
jgi:hypothetical protein